MNFEQKDRTTSLVRLSAGFLILFLSVALVSELDAGISVWFKERGVTKNPLEYPLVAVAMGLAANFLFRITKSHAIIAPATKTELLLKIGLVLLGSRIAIGELLAEGIGGLIHAVIMVVSVFFFTWWLAGKLKIDEKLKAVMATAVSICGVSAAVVGAGTIHSETAQQVAALVKLSQNVFIGIAAFFLAVYFVVNVEKKPGERPSLMVVWERFPKFVLGFILVSMITSLGLFSEERFKLIALWNKWTFTLVFFCIGLELSLRTSIASDGHRCSCFCQRQCSIRYWRLRFPILSLVY